MTDEDEDDDDMTGLTDRQKRVRKRALLRKMEPSRRRVRVFESLALGRNRHSIIFGVLTRERSPRRVGCAICHNTIHGNKEDRISIQMPSKYPGADRPWWMSKPVKVFFHPQCLIAFCGRSVEGWPMDLELAVFKDLHLSRCEHCARWTTSLPIEETGAYYCGLCAPIWSPKAVKRAVRQLKKLQADLVEVD